MANGSSVKQLSDGEVAELPDPQEETCQHRTVGDHANPCKSNMGWLNFNVLVCLSLH